MNRAPSLSGIARQFEIEGKYRHAVPYGSGHINDTYCVFFDRLGSASRSVPSRCILQRINQNVFHDPTAVMENIERVTAHVATQIAAEPDRDRRVLTLIPSRGGRAWHIDRDGSYWRAYRMIENAHACDEIHSPAQAFEAARAFGLFQKQLANLPVPRLRDTIPDFHHTPKRLRVLEEMIEQDPACRAAGAGPEIAFALERKPMTTALLDAHLPERVTHNDTKFNNVLLDDQTGEAICVIDLDTVMPGLAPYDFGDLVRTAASPAKEDEQDLSEVRLRFDFFEAIARGYLSMAGEFLTGAEKESLALAGKLITFEQGVRFLSDYLAGDLYYKVHRAGQNLERCRTQFKLVESMEAQEAAMERLVRSLK
ncbi:MAG TPA: aminoglycoside phosphotransferase family protein [Terracidiphilus sp.]|jgi:hypothetical protein